MAKGLSVSDVVTVSIVLAPTAAPNRNFGTLLIMGSSPVIDANERVRDYTNLTAVAQDFGVQAPEYLAAQEFFEQSPQPYSLKIGRWAQTATNGTLHGADVAPVTQAANLAALMAVTAGTLSVPLDGTTQALTGLNFGAVANLNGVAGVINAALGANGSCVWDGTRFTIMSKTAGPSSTVGYPSSPSGIDIAMLLGIKSTSGGPLPIPGVPSETANAVVQLFAGMTSDFYALTFAPLTPLTTNEMLQIAATIEGTAPARVWGVTLQNQASYDGTSTVDVGAILKASGYSRTVMQYSGTNAYAICSFFGKALSVNFNGSNTTLTMKFKQEPGVIAETLTETKANVLKAKNINVFVNYENGAAIVQEGVVANGRFWDEVHGLDWLANAVQTDLFNVLYQSLTKIPQTDDGVHVLLTTMEATLARAVENGLIAPGVWNAEGFGQLKRGDPLPKGFYVYAPLVRTQAQADREARKSPPLQAAIKMAGAIHSVDTIISVNR